MEQNLNFLKIVDTRERSNCPEQLYIPLLKTGWVRDKLDFGDFQFFAHDGRMIIITRKTWIDLMQSIGAVFSKQLDEILEHNSEGINIILLEGKPQREVVSDRMVTSQGLSRYTYEGLDNYLASWQDLGFKLRYTFSTDHTVRRLNETYAYYQKPYHLASCSTKWSENRIPAFPPRTRGKTALKALARFGSLQGVANAGIRDLQEELGNKMGQLVFDHFHRT